MQVLIIMVNYNTKELIKIVWIPFINILKILSMK